VAEALEATLSPSKQKHHLISQKQFFISLRQKIMIQQRAHINVNLCDSPSIKGLFGYEWMIWNEAKCACFENYLQ
jgi:hypothetical protein